MTSATSEEERNHWWIEGLSACRPLPQLADKLSLFGQFVGDWEITECRNLQPDGTWSVDRGEVHWRWILEGRALQDIWSTIDERTGYAVPIGTTIRFYDASLDAWRSVWISPLQGTVRPFIGRPIGSEIVLEGTSSRQNPLRWIFSEITESSFRWRSEERLGPALGWVMNEEMHIRRLPGETPRSTR